MTDKQPSPDYPDVWRADVDLFTQLSTKLSKKAEEIADLLRSLDLDVDELVNAQVVEALRQAVSQIRINGMLWVEDDGRVVGVAAEVDEGELASNAMDGADPPRTLTVGVAEIIDDALYVAGGAVPQDETRKGLATWLRAMADRIEAGKAAKE